MIFFQIKFKINDLILIRQKMLAFNFLCLLIIKSTLASSMTTPPQSAVVVAFEDVYDLSLLAYTISDLGIETTLVIPADEENYYERLITIKLIKINASLKISDDSHMRAQKLCDNFISDSNIMKYIQTLQPTFIIFPGVRHDACLLPWTASVSAIPIIWARGYHEELYVFLKTGMALPVHESGFIHSFIENLNLKYYTYKLESNYVTPMSKKFGEKFPLADSLTNLYSNVQLVLWGADPILRVNSALLTQLVAEIGCHHCRGTQPLPSELQKELVEFRAGTIIILLDREYESLIKDAVEKLPNDRQGLAIVWKTKHIMIKNRPKNLFTHKDADRQDLIGYPRTRVVICHCTDSEFLESAYHGSPIICIPRNYDENRNALRAVELGFGAIEKTGVLAETVARIITEIHNSTKYRESARLVSQAIRDRSDHAMDRIQYWLGYTARHNGEGKNLLMPKKVSTYNEIFQTITGFFIGVLFTVLGTILFFITQAVVETAPKERKKKYKK